MGRETSFFSIFPWGYKFVCASFILIVLIRNYFVFLFALCAGQQGRICVHVEVKYTEIYPVILFLIHENVMNPALNFIRFLELLAITRVIKWICFRIQFSVYELVYELFFLF